MLHFIFMRWKYIFGWIIPVIVCIVMNSVVKVISGVSKLLGPSFPSSSGTVLTPAECNWPVQLESTERFPLWTSQTTGPLHMTCSPHPTGAHLPPLSAWAVVILGGSSISILIKVSLDLTSGPTDYYMPWHDNMCLFPMQYSCD